MFLKILVGAAAVGLIASAILPSTEQPTTAKAPVASYCKGPATAGLPECGWTRESGARRHETAEVGEYIQGLRSYVHGAAKLLPSEGCGKPVAELSLAEIHECEALRQ